MRLSSESSSSNLKSDKLPKVSVVVPFYNQHEFLAEALQSVLDQGYPQLEVIVVDDGSTEGSVDWVIEMNECVRLIRQNNAGPAAARNRGIKESTGEIIAFIDSDDIWPKDKLKDQLQPLIMDAKIDIVLAKVKKLFRSVENATLFQCDGDSFYTIQLGCLLVRKLALSKVGLFDESLMFSEDQDWFLKAREQSLRIVKMDIDGLYYRSHEASLTHRKGTGPDFGLIQVLKRSLNRRRDSVSGSAKSLLSLSDLSEWKAST